MKKRKERKKGILQQRRISCEETFLNNSNPTAHVHCKILSIRTNQTHLHRPSFFQRISKIYPPFEISLHRKKKKEKEKVTNSPLFSSFSLQGLRKKIFPLSLTLHLHVLSAIAKNLERLLQLARISGTRLLSRVREFNSQVFFT